MERLDDEVDVVRDEGTEEVVVVDVRDAIRTEGDDC